MKVIKSLVLLIIENEKNKRITGYNIKFPPKISWPWNEMWNLHALYFNYKSNYGSFFNMHFNLDHCIG